MANVLNRATNLYLESVNTPDYDVSEWVINPDLSEVEGFAPYYWIINPDDTVSLMTESQRKDTDTWAPYFGSDLAAAYRIKADEINAYRDVRLNSGWVYKGIRYDSDVVSRSNMTGIMTLIGTGYILPDSFTFRAQDNTDVPFDNASFTEFYQDSCIWANIVYKVSWMHKANVKNLTTIPAIAAYDYSAGWPEGYSRGN
ncbi:MAG: DUF4376 domain-containing protein [Verrucomicrobiaceae bacterium]|nr:MAG: DUF4376 domain-containing protein [Verrucomicrobiaceae bacterium]